MTPKQISLELIAANSHITVQQMADALGMNKRNAQKHILIHPLPHAVEAIERIGLS